jgi:hypothetical protein
MFAAPYRPAGNHAGGFLFAGRNSTCAGVKVNMPSRLGLAWLILHLSASAQGQVPSKVVMLTDSGSSISKDIVASPDDRLGSGLGVMPSHKGDASFRSQPFNLELRQHKFWDRKNILLHGTAAAAAAADFWTTRRAITRGSRELNPLARPFARSSAAFAAYKAGSWGTYLSLSYLFHRKGWHRLERILPVVAISTDSATVGFNLKRTF